MGTPGYMNMIERCKETGALDMMELRICYNCDDVYSRKNMAYIKNKDKYLCKSCIDNLTIETFKKETL